MLSLINTLATVTSAVGLVYLLQELFTKKPIKQSSYSKPLYYVFRFGLAIVGAGQLASILAPATLPLVLINVGTAISVWSYTRVFEHKYKGPWSPWSSKNNQEVKK